MPSPRTASTYDDEHHRVAFADFGSLTPRDRDASMAVPSTDPPGLHHVAFTFGSIAELLENYTRLAERGTHPFRSINHGPTTSMYYADPDGNRVELLIDNFATTEEGFRPGCVLPRSSVILSASTSTPTIWSSGSGLECRWLSW